MSLSARAIALQGVGFNPGLLARQGFADLPQTAVQPSQGGGAAGSSYHSPRTSRYSDERAYDPARVAERLEAVVVAGKTYDPFDPALLDVLEAEARRPEPAASTELERQERKLARTFTVMTQDRIIEVPLFRPMLREMPPLAGAWSFTFEDYAAKVQAELDEERRRILMLLSANDWP